MKAEAAVATKRGRLGLAGLLILGLLPIGLFAGDQGKAPSVVAPSPKLASLGWIAGAWRAHVDGDQLDEVWTAPSGDSMFGSFRWMKGGKAWMFEMLTIMVEGEDVILRIKHFDNKGVGWEEKTDAVTMKLVKLEGHNAYFERIKSEEVFTLSFHKVEDDVLSVRVPISKDGKEEVQDFRFCRTGATEGK